MAVAKSYTDVLSDFQDGKFGPLYLLYGEERYFIDRLQEKLLEKALAPHEKDFNLDLLYGSEVDAQQALSACRAYPMMANRRVVVIRDFDKLKDNAIFKVLGDQFNPACVVFLVCSGKPNLSKHPYRALKEGGIAIEFKALYANQMPVWIKQLAKEQGFSIDNKAVQMLSDYVGVSLSAVSAELGKLSAFVGDRKVLTAEDVVQASGQTREYNVFELQRVVGENSYEDAMRISERLLQQSPSSSSEANRIVSVLTSFFIKLWQLTGLQSARAPENEMASAIGVSPYILKEYLSALRRFDKKALDNAISCLLAADYELKGGSLRSDRLILDLLFRRILAS
ncbi:MAG: DNA polymerase III subunit delta [Bacteroidetes bacterium]|nr:DNA polymerase III subunit delta [Bacteroidota bacterium]